MVVALTMAQCRAKGATASGEAPAPPAVEQPEALADDVQTDLARNAWPAAEAKAREHRE